MNADPDAQLRLLDLQSLDSTLDRLAHRRRTLPEIEQIADLEQRLSGLGDEIVKAETEDRDLGREQTKIETDVDGVRSRTERDQKRLDGGAVSSARELENLQSEIASLHRRQGDLEDQVLEVMEQRESVQHRLAELTDERERLQAELDAAVQRRDQAFAEIEQESVSVAAQRGDLAGTLPADLLDLYGKIRESASGVGAAPLHRGRCEGCHLQLNTVDLNALREAPADRVVRCEECRRILVRTAESGL